jgi:hypothetical protein
MSCRPWEESVPDPETPNPVTPTKPPRNAWAGQDNPDAENLECQYDSDEPFLKKRKTLTETKKLEWHLIVYVPIKQWLTGERAEMGEEEMMFDVTEEARKEMLLSGFKKPIHPKPTNLGLWKKGQVHESRCITYTICKCPMSGRAGCQCMLRLVMAKDAGYLKLQHSELRHHAASHAQDDSKKLKYGQMVAIRDAVVTVPQLSAAMLRRNMEMHESPTKTIPAEHMRSFQHQFYRASKKLCDKQLKGFALDDALRTPGSLLPVVNAGAQAQRS